jgi:hypothetical protein
MIIYNNLLNLILKNKYYYIYLIYLIIKIDKENIIYNYIGIKIFVF